MLLKDTAGLCSLSRSLCLLLCVHVCLYKCFSFTKTCCTLWRSLARGHLNIADQRVRFCLAASQVLCVLFFLPLSHTQRHRHAQIHTHTHSPPNPFVFFGQYSSAALLPRVLCGSPTGAPLLECSVSHISTQHTLTPVQIIRNFTNGKPARNSEKACAYM